MPILTRGPRELFALAGAIAAFAAAMALHTTVNVWIATGAAAVFAVALTTAAAPGDVRPRVAPASPRAAFAGVAVGLGMAVATWLLFPVAASRIAPLGSEVSALYELLRQRPGPLRALPVLVAIVVAEELVWRGFAIDLFRRRLGAGGAVVGAAAVALIPQLALQSPVLIAVTAACGLVWGTLRIRYGGLLAPVVAHLVWDLLVFVALPVA